MTSLKKPSSNNTHFESWLTHNFPPCGIVYSTPTAQQIFSKNNLTPSEFLRPLGNFTNYKPISFNHEEGYNKTIYDFKIDFYDATSYKKIPQQEIEFLLNNCINSTPSLPNWKLNNKHITKNDITPIKNNLIYYSFPWFNEYESTLIECLKFNETEIYQQPFLNVFIISIKDPIDCIDKIKQSQKPLLISESIYEDPLLNIGLILYDCSESNSPIEKKEAENIMNEFQKRYFHIKFGFFNINTNPYSAVLTYSINDDVWMSYLHKVDLYKQGNSSLLQNLMNTKYLRGKYISQKERDEIQAFLFNVLNTQLKERLKNKINDLLKKVSEGKGIKGLFTKKKKESKHSRTINQYKIVNLTNTEKELYLLSILLFFIRDYKGAYSSSKKLYSNIQGKLPQYETNILQHFVIMHFLKSKKKKKVNFNQPLEEYSKSHSHNNSHIYYYLRSSFILIRMQESMYNYLTCMKILELTRNHLHNTKIELFLLKEKQYLYYLYIQPLQLRKFALCLIKTALSYNITQSNFMLYHCILFDIGQFYNILLHSNKDKRSFNPLKVYLNKYMSNICNNINYKEGSLFFCQNTLELMRYHQRSNSNEYNYLIESMLNNLTMLFVDNFQMSPQLTKCSLVEIDNSSLLVIEEQDYEIEQFIINEREKNNNNNNSKHNNNYLHNKSSIKFSCFDKYSYESKGNKYSQLSKNDLKAIHFLDTITNKKQISNFYIKRHYITNKGNTLYIRFNMKNPYNIDLVLSNIKIIIDTSTNNADNIIHCEEKDITLIPHIEQSVELKLNIIDKGTFTIKGIEMKLSSLVTIVHLFTYIKTNSLYNYRIKKKSKDKLTVTQLTTTTTNEVSVYNKKQKNNFSFEIYDNNETINISFPKGKDITLYQHQLYYYPIHIENKSNFNITSITLFVNDNNSNNVLCDYLKKDINLPFETNTVFYIPLLPINIGIFFIKLIIKFISDSRYNEIEIKRYVFKLNVIHSITFNINAVFKEMNMSNQNVTYDIKLNCFISNHKQILSIKHSHYNDILYNKTNWNLLSSSDWFVINSDVNSFEKYYNTYSMVYDMKQAHNKTEFNLFTETNKENVFDYKVNINEDDNYESIAKGVNCKLGKNNIIIFPFSITDTEQNEIKCIYYNNIDINIPMMDILYYKRLVKDIIKVVAVKENKIDNDIETYVTLTVTITKNENLNGIIHSFIIEPNLTDNDYEWLGLYTWECIYDISPQDNTTPYKEQFILSTLHKGIIEVNKLLFTISTNLGTYTIGKVGGDIYIQI